MADYNARIDGFDLEIENLDDTIEKAIAQYEFPFSDGALLEDLGQKARVVKIKCYFYNETYETHREFIDYLTKNTLFEFVHPKHGLMNGLIESVALRFDDRIQVAEVDITFIENIKVSTEPVVFESISTKSEDVFTTAVVEQQTEFAGDVREELGAEAETILTKTLDPAKTVFSQFTGLTKKGRDYVKQIDTYEASLKSSLTTVANPANSLLTTIDFGTNLPGRIIGAAASTAERYAILHQGSKSSPTRFAQSYVDGMTALENSLSFGKHTRLATAQRLSVEVAGTYEDDQDNRRRAKRLSAVKSFDESGNYIKKESEPTLLTMKDIERSLYVVREYLQARIDEARNMDSLKAIAVSLMNHVYTVKIESKKLISITVDNSIPLHLICLKYGLPYNAADRLRTVNGIKHPNFVDGEVQVYVK